ncbi:MAG: hypothetical protein HY645_15350 [Acidobacteria bacterium]|nr:hypothetical protein [Acidobacteriota bacterium]
MRAVPKPVLLLVMLTPLLISSSCGGQTIAEIKADPYKYEKKEAHIAGVVKRSFAVLNMGFYELEDPSGAIYVITDEGVPAKDSRVEVRGKTINAFSFAGQNYGTVIQESRRKLHN